jgi:hypothetical protein
MNKHNEKNVTEVQPIDPSALKKALKVRSTLRAGLLTVISHGPVGGPPFCPACGRGI